MQRAALLRIVARSSYRRSIITSSQIVLPVLNCSTKSSFNCPTITMPTAHQWVNNVVVRRTLSSSTILTLSSAAGAENNGDGGGDNISVIHDATAQMFRLQMDGTEEESPFLKYRMLDRNGRKNWDTK
jgi:hypothetical protein